MSALKRPFLRCSRLFFAPLMALLSCTQPKPIEGFDSQAWKADPNGCKGQRAAIWEAFKPNRTTLKGYEENDLTFLLGPAEEQELLEKGQKTYSYYLSGSKFCPDGAGQRARVLQVRVNATSRVSEVQEVTR